MSLHGVDPREQLLSAAWDEAAAVTSLPGYPSAKLRPVSVNLLRRAEKIGLRCIAGDFRAVLASLSPSEALGELEALSWLLSADLEDVREVLRLGSWLAALDRYELPRAAIAPMRAEMARALDLVQAAMFTTEEKPKAPAPAGRSGFADAEPPAHLVRPGTVATIAFVLAGKIGRPADEVLEWVPACQVFQMVHCSQWGNATVWTVDPRRAVDLDPYEGREVEEDPGFGEEIDF